MNLAHQIGIAEIQFVVAAINVDALCIEHRPHRAIEDVDGVAVKKVSEMVRIGLLSRLVFGILVFEVTSVL